MVNLDVDFSFRRRSIAGYVTEDERKIASKRELYKFTCEWLSVSNLCKRCAKET